MSDKAQSSKKRKRRRKKRPASPRSTEGKKPQADEAAGEIETAPTAERPEPRQDDLFELADSKAESPQSEESTAQPPAESGESPGSEKAAEPEPRPGRRRSFLKRRRRDEEIAARSVHERHDSVQAAPPEGAPVESPPPLDSAAGAQPVQKPLAGAEGDSRQPAFAARAPTESEPPTLTPAEAVGSSPAVAGPPAEDRGEQEGISASRRGIGGIVLSLIVGMLRLALTIAVVLGLIGGAAYLVMQYYVGGREVTVPVLLGDTLDKALEKLREEQLYLELDQRGREFSDEVPQGRVLAQFPAPHTTVKARTPVRVVVSKGPARKRVPDLVGRSEIIAGVELRKISGADLDVGSRSYAFWPGTKKGEVIAQDPPAGTPVHRGSRINLLISLGPPRVYYKMPDLNQKTLQESRILLGAMHLTITDIRETNKPGVRSGIVVAQQPRAGQRVSRGDAIILTIATGLGGGIRP